MITGAYAGLRSRVIAFAYDYVLIAGYLTCAVVAGMLVNRYFPATAGALFDDPVSGQVAGFFIVTLPVSLYFILAESSARQATWGKRRQGLRVTRVDGARLSVPHAIGRTALKFLPWELAHACVWHISLAPQPAPPWTTWGLALVWILVVANVVCSWVSPRHQALYDRIAGTVVTRREMAAAG